MKALLVHPKYPATFWSFKYALKFVGKKAAYPPLGLLTIAAMLPSDWDLRLVDLNIEPLQPEHLQWADCVLLSAMLVQKQSAREVLRACRQAQVRTIVGGPLFSTYPEEYLDLADHLVIGEAEDCLEQFLDDLRRGRARQIYQASSFPDLDRTPVPRWDLAKLDAYATLMLQVSRGCPFDCEFCNITALYGRRPRLKSASQVLAELEVIYRLGWRASVFVVDDNFIGNKVKIKKILRELIPWMEAHGHPFTFVTEASINLADDQELIDLMVAAGFDTVFIGLETPEEKSLLECAKIQNRGRDLVAQVRHLQASGLKVFGGYIIGFDNDDTSIFSRQIRFIQESGVVTAMVGLLNAVPKTKLWRRLQAENRLCADASGDNTDGSINFIPRMDLNTLLQGYRQVVRTIYSPRHFYQRLCRFLEDYKPYRPPPPITRADLRAFFKSALVIGVLSIGPSQWYYWKMFLKSLLRHRELLGEAMRFMAYGYHFRKVARKI